jgi:hypothetical protein
MSTTLFEKKNFVELLSPINFEKGWHTLINNTVNEIESILQTSPNKYNGFRIYEIKEKLGTLRIYTNSPPDIQIDNIIKKAIDDSETICEVCGKKATIKNFKVRCSGCRKKGL